jgi:hypothetical protein
MSASAPVPGTPRSGDSPPRDFEANYTKDQVRYAPHLVFIKALERLDEVMASQDDPYPAFLAWSSDLEVWGRDQEDYWRDVDRIEAIEDELFADYGGLSVLEYVALWKPVFVGVMRRAGMFIAPTQNKPGETTSTTGHRMANNGDGHEEGAS